MILAFKTHFPNGKPTYFFDKISETDSFESNFRFSEGCREVSEKTTYKEWFDLVCIDKDIKPKIHTLRKDKANRWKKGTKIHFTLWNRTPRQTCFGILPCTGTQRCVVNPIKKTINVITPGQGMGVKEITDIQQFAKNDGFDTVEEFWEYFDKPEAYTIIHWTDFKY
jgi:hypothetical protein